MLQSVGKDINHKMESIYSGILSLNYNVVIRDLVELPDKYGNIVNALPVSKEIASLEKNEDVIYIYLENQEALLSSSGVYSGVAVPPLTGPDKTCYTAFNPIGMTAGAFAITSADKNPAATMKWVDYLYSDKGTRRANEGINLLYTLTFRR